MTVSASIHPCSRASERALATRIANTRPAPNVRMLFQFQDQLEKELAGMPITFVHKDGELDLFLHGRHYITFVKNID